MVEITGLAQQPTLLKGNIGTEETHGSHMMTWSQLCEGCGQSLAPLMSPSPKSSKPGMTLQLWAFWPTGLNWQLVPSVLSDPSYGSDRKHETQACDWLRKVEGLAAWGQQAIS